MVNDSKIKLATKAYTKIDGEKFKTLPEKRGRVRNHVNGHGLERFGKQFAISDQVRVKDHKTGRWSKEAKIIAVLGKRAFRLSNSTKEFTKNRRFFRKMLEAKVKTVPMSMKGAATQGRQAQSDK